VRLLPNTEYLARVIEAAALAREEKPVAAPFVGDVDPAFLDLMLGVPYSPMVPSLMM
jgi:hypothetical protein